MAALTFGYWNIRGLMQPIRLLCEHAGVKWQEKLYNVKAMADGSYDRSEWTNEKFTLGLPFPNLPYMIDNETNCKLTQSDAILRYVAQKHCPEMLGKDLKTQANVNMLVGVLADLKTQMNRVCYGPQAAYESGLAGFKVAATRTITQILDFMEHRPYLAADYLTYVDFVAYEHFDVTRLMIPDILEDAPEKRKAFLNFMTRIEELPRIASYRKSPQFIERPINGATACFK